MVVSGAFGAEGLTFFLLLTFYVTVPALVQPRADQGRRVIHIKRATPSSSFINPGTELPRRTGRGAPAPT